MAGLSDLGRGLSVDRSFTGRDFGRGYRGGGLGAGFSVSSIADLSRGRNGSSGGGFDPSFVSRASVEARRLSGIMRLGGITGFHPEINPELGGNVGGRSTPRRRA